MIFNMNNIVLSIVITHMLVAADGQTYSEMDTLLGHLFNESRYNKILRPLQNQSHVMKVNFTQHLTSIRSFDITMGELATTGFFEISWTDELLTWDPSLFGGKEIIPLPKGKFWKPEFFISNGAAEEDTAVYNDDFSPAWVTYQGNVIMVPAGSYQTRCNIDTTLYPFDIHECSFQILVSNHHSNEIMLFSPTGDLDTTILEENGEWEIENTNATIVLLQEDNIDKLSIPMASTIFSLKRRPLSLFINRYAVFMLMGGLNIFTCFVRPNSGERMTFAVTLFLSLVFTSTLTTENIPNNSLKMPLISYGILISNFLNTAAVLWSIFIVHLANTNIVRKRLPTFVMKLVMRNRQRQTHKRKNKIMPEDKPELAAGFQENETDEKQDSVKGVTANDITGCELADVLDKMYFWIFMFLFLILNAVLSTLALAGMHRK